MPLNNPNCYTCQNKDCTIQKKFNQKGLKVINEKKHFVKVKRKQSIALEGILLNELYFIYEGKAKVVSTGLYGKQQIQRLAKNGEFLGYKGLVQNKVLPVSIYALEDSSFCVVERDLYLSLLKEDPDLMLDTLIFIVEQFTDVEQRMKDLTMMNVREKVAEALLFIYKTFGNKKTGELEVILSRKEIAEIAMTTKEQVSKSLSEYHDEGKITVAGKKIIIKKLEALNKIAGK